MSIPNDILQQVILESKEIENEIQLLNTISGDVYLTVKLPFKLSRIPPKYKNLNDSQENVLFLKNNTFSQFDVIEVKKKVGDGKRIIGYLFKPSMLFEDGSKYLFKDNNPFQVAILKSIGKLILENKNKILEKTFQNPTSIFEFVDFFHDDLILGVFPFEWSKIFDKEDTTEILLNIHNYGFYSVKADEDNFSSPENDLQRIAYKSLMPNTKKFRKYIEIHGVCEKVKGDGYTYEYLENLSQTNENEILKFYQLYGLVEIYKDEILKYEIREKVSRIESDLSLHTGYKFNKFMQEISKDKHVISKLFSDKYSTIDQSLIFDLSIDIISLQFDNIEEVKSISGFDQALYYLRNKIVHDIQFIYKKTPAEIKELMDNLNKINLKLDYLLIDTIKFLNFN